MVTNILPELSCTCPLVIDEVHRHHILVLLVQRLEVFVEGGGRVPRWCNDGCWFILDVRQLCEQQRDGTSNLQGEMRIERKTATHKCATD